MALAMCGRVEEVHPAVQCVEDHGDANEVVGWVVGQVLSELANVGVHLHHHSHSHTWFSNTVKFILWTGMRQYRIV